MGTYASQCGAGGAKGSKNRANAGSAAERAALRMRAARAAGQSMQSRCGRVPGWFFLASPFEYQTFPLQFAPLPS
jgi:hypothetical protein